MFALFEPSQQSTKHIQAYLDISWQSKGTPKKCHVYFKKYGPEAALWLLCLSRALVGLGEGAMAD